MKKSKLLTLALPLLLLGSGCSSNKKDCVVYDSRDSNVSIKLSLDDVTMEYVVKIGSLDDIWRISVDNVHYLPTSHNDFKILYDYVDENTPDVLYVFTYSRLG